MYEYKAIVRSVYDGDSIRVDIDLGFNAWIMNRALRIDGIDTPEVRGSQRKAGLVVRDYLRSVLNTGQVIRIKSKELDKYGRVLASVSIDDLDITELLAGMGYAKIYNGGKKKEWTEKQLINIINSV